MSRRPTHSRAHDGRSFLLTLTLLVGASVTGTACSRSASRANAGESASTVATGSAGAGASTSVAYDSVTSTVGGNTASPLASAPGRGATPSPPSPDTARGIVQRVGADPLSTLILMPREGAVGEALALVSASPTTLSSTELSAAEGLEVMVRGTRTGERATAAGPNGAMIFRVTQYAVRSADGVPARDGILVQLNGQWILEGTDGSRSNIVSLPSALQSQRGARVFLTGPVSQAPQSFGILRAK